MSKTPVRNEPTGYPEYAVRKETICDFFSPPMPSSTFHDRVTAGIIVPIKGIRGFYKLNDSLRRLGLREVAELPNKVTRRSTEDIIRIAFNGMDSAVFPAPTWFHETDALHGADADLATLLMERYTEHVQSFETDSEKQHFFQGVLDVDYILKKNGNIDELRL